MDQMPIDCIDAGGHFLPIPDAEQALRQGEPLHRLFRPKIPGDYLDHLSRMAADGAAITHLIDDGEIRAIGVWRVYLTTFCGRRFEIDDLVTAESQRSRGYGATLIRTLEAKARSLSCDVVMLTSATWRVDAHRFYFRERFTIASFLFSKVLD